MEKDIENKDHTQNKIPFDSVGNYLNDTLFEKTKKIVKNKINEHLHNKIPEEILNMEPKHISIPLEDSERKSIEVKVYGEGENTIIISPGFMRNGDHYSKMAKYLAKKTNTRIVTFDTRSHYIDPKTNKPENVFSFEGMKKDLNELTSYFKDNSKEVKIIGFSLGAFTSSFIAEKSKASKLCLVSCPLGFKNGLGYSYFKKRWTKKSTNEIKEDYDNFWRFKKNIPPYIAMNLGNNNAPMKFRGLYVQNPKKFLKEFLKFPVLSDLEEQNINIPTKFIYGRKDVILRKLFKRFSKDLSEEYLSRIKPFKNKEIKIILNGYHGFQINPSTNHLTKQEEKLISELEKFIVEKEIKTS